MRGDALGDFELRDDVDGIDVVGETEQVGENRGRDVVRQVAVDAEAACGTYRSGRIGAGLRG